MDNFFLIPGLSQLMNGFRTVNAVDVLLFLLCLIGVCFSWGILLMLSYRF